MIDSSRRSDNYLPKYLLYLSMYTSAYLNITNTWLYEYLLSINLYTLSHSLLLTTFTYLFFPIFL